MRESPVEWLTDKEWRNLPLRERSLIIQAVEIDIRGVREIGSNRGPRVQQYQSAAGAPAGSPWCGCFQFWADVTAGFPRKALPRFAARVYSWFLWAKAHGLLITDPKLLKRGDKGFWLNDDRTGHIFAIRKVWKDWLGRWWVETLEGNTDPGGSREGDGAYRRKRRWTRRMAGIDMTKLEKSLSG